MYLAHPSLMMNDAKKRDYWGIRIFSGTKMDVTSKFWHVIVSFLCDNAVSFLPWKMIAGEMSSPCTTGKTPVFRKDTN
jgi:hypothetical protein